MTVGAYTTIAAQHRNEIGKFHKTIEENSSIIEKALKRTANSSSEQHRLTGYKSDDFYLATLFAAQRGVSDNTAALPKLRVNNALQAACLLLNATSIFNPQQPHKQVPHFIDDGPRQSGTLALTPGASEAGINAGDWRDVDPFRLPSAVASPLPVQGPTVLGTITNFIQDGLDIASGDHHIHADAITISSKELNRQRRHAIKRLLINNKIPFEKQTFQQQRRDEVTIKGKNMVVNLSGPAAHQPGKHVIVTAHFDKIGDGSEGFYDNAVSCAALVDMAKHFKGNLPEGTRLQIVFMDAEEQGLLGSKAFVESLAEKNITPDLVINIDLMGGAGKEVYAGASNSSHNAWFHSDDLEAAKVPRPSTAAEVDFLNLLKEDIHGFNVVQNEATPMSDHLSFQYKGFPAVGLSVVNTGEAAKTEKFVKAFSNLANAESAWKEAFDKIVKLPKGTPQYNAYAPEAKAIRQNLTNAQSLFAQATDADTTYQRLHNSNDQESLFHSGNTNAFTKMMKVAIAKFLS